VFIGLGVAGAAPGLLQGVQIVLDTLDGSAGEALVWLEPIEAKRVKVDTWISAGRCEIAFT
jgi:hypothetical protein